jgi:phosphohistidine phosphatase SixA
MNFQNVLRSVVAHLMACFKAFLKAGVMAGVVACTMASTTVQASDLSNKLQSPDYVLLMRHTRAPGIGDPANYTLDDCKTQRNLSDEGRKQAVAVGHWLKKQGVQTADVQSSAWCRCKDTAELLNLGPVTVEPALASFFDDMAQAKVQNQQLEKFIATQLKTKGKQALVLVTHHVNIYEFMGENIASGDMVLAKVDSNGKLLTYKLIPRPN